MNEYERAYRASKEPQKSTPASRRSPRYYDRPVEEMSPSQRRSYNARQAKLSHIKEQIRDGKLVSRPITQEDLDMLDAARKRRRG